MRNPDQEKSCPQKRKAGAASGAVEKAARSEADVSHATAAEESQEKAGLKQRVKALEAGFSAVRALGLGFGKYRINQDGETKSLKDQVQQQAEEIAELNRKIAGLEMVLTQLVNVMGRQNQVTQSMLEQYSAALASGAVRQIPLAFPASPASRAGLFAVPLPYSPVGASAAASVLPGTYGAGASAAASAVETMLQMQFSAGAGAAAPSQ